MNWEIQWNIRNTLLQRRTIGNVGSILKYTHAIIISIVLKTGNIDLNYENYCNGLLFKLMLRIGDQLSVSRMMNSMLQIYYSYMIGNIASTSWTWSICMHPPTSCHDLTVGQRWTLPKFYMDTWILTLQFQFMQLVILGVYIKYIDENWCYTQFCVCYSCVKMPNKVKTCLHLLLGYPGWMQHLVLPSPVSHCD